MTNYKEFLIWLITPQDEFEKEKFKDVVDDHIQIMNRIDRMTKQELIDEINVQLKPFGTEIDSPTKDQKQ